MKTRIFLLILLAAAVVGLLLWSPWLTREIAEQRAVQAFSSAWNGVADGCGVNCKGCGAVEARRVTGGWEVTIEYACGLIPEDTPQYHKRGKGFVSVLGTVHGLPRP